jgi:hypothetical protein
MESDGRFIFSVGLQVMANTFRNFDLDPVLLNRCLEPDITDNKVFGGQYGLFLVDFSGTVSKNVFRTTKRTAAYIAPSGDIWYEDNKHINCGVKGTNDENRTPSLLTFARDGATTIPDMPANPFVNYNRNEIRSTGSSGSAPYLFFGADTVPQWRVTENRCSTGDTKVGRISGTLVDQFRNDFPGYHNSAQNETAPPDAATLITHLRQACNQIAASLGTPRRTARRFHPTKRSGASEVCRKGGGTMGFAPKSHAIQIPC